MSQTTKKANLYWQQGDVYWFRDVVGVPCLCGSHYITYSVVVENQPELDVEITPWKYGTQLSLVHDGKVFYVGTQQCYTPEAAPSVPSTIQTLVDDIMAIIYRKSDPYTRLSEIEHLCLKVMNNVSDYYDDRYED